MDYCGEGDGKQIKIITHKHYSGVCGLYLHFVVVVGVSIVFTELNESA